MTPSTPSWPNGAQVCEVEIDPDTGEVSLARIASCDDIGRIINYTIVEGQVHGGIAQGAGQALFEQARYDAESGQLLSGSLMDYAVPRADNAPSFHFETRNVPSTTNAMGMKGAGEAGTIGATPAVLNAVTDALWRAYGIGHIEMPATPQRVWSAIQEAQAK